MTGNDRIILIMAAFDNNVNFNLICVECCIKLLLHHLNNVKIYTILLRYNVALLNALLLLVLLYLSHLQLIDNIDED